MRAGTVKPRRRDKAGYGSPNHVFEQCLTRRKTSARFNMFETEELSFTGRHAAGLEARDCRAMFGFVQMKVSVQQNLDAGLGACAQPSAKIWMLLQRPRTPEIRHDQNAVAALYAALAEKRLDPFESVAMLRRYIVNTYDELSQAASPGFVDEFLLLHAQTATGGLYASRPRYAPRFYSCGKRV
jgi:hypothetical protein